MSAVLNNPAGLPVLDEVDRQILIATQAGLPLVPQPYHAVAEMVGIESDELLQRLHRLLADGVIRRIAAVPNHYKLGYRANGMTVWDVDDGQISRLGQHVGQLPFVSHCYRRPRHLPIWRYNLFAMVHGRDRDEVQTQIETIQDCLGAACRAHEVLYSTRILKKTGLRMQSQANQKET